MGLKDWWRNRPAVQRRNKLQQEHREYNKLLKKQEEAEKAEIDRRRYIEEGSEGKRAIVGSWRGFKKGAIVTGRTAVNLPYGVGRGEKSVIGIAFDKILTWFFGLAKILAILLIIFLVIVIPTRLYATGTTDYAFTKAGVVVRDTGEPLAKTGLTEIWRGIWNPNQLVTEGSFALEEATENRFLEIEQIFPSRNKFESETPILIKADFLAHNLEKDSTAIVSAELNEYEGPIEVKLPVKEGSEENTFIIPKEQEYLFTANILFPEGIKTEKAIEGASGKVTINYEATAESKWRAYGLHSSIKKERFKKLKELNDPLITSSGIGKSSLAYNSPIMITFTINQKQPFEEGIFYTFSIDLRKDVLTKGNIKKLNRFLLYIPENIVLDPDKRFCDFEKVESTEDDQLIVYKVTDSFLNYINTDCSLVDKKDCELIYKEENHGFCGFKFKELPKEPIPTFVEFRALAEYTFTLEKPFFIGLIPKKTAVGDVCKSILSENECKQAKGCKSVYTITGSFNSCETCPLTLLQCSDYDNENDCNNDSCNLGNCAWKDNTCKEEVIA